MAYKFTITKTMHYYGYPQAEYRYNIDSEYFNGSVKYYGNMGFDYPVIKATYKICNGYMQSMHLFMRAFYDESIRAKFLDLRREGDKVSFTLDYAEDYSGNIKIVDVA